MRNGKHRDYMNSNQASLTFILLSFEGPDRYSRAGGLGTRVTELSRTLSSMGFETHLFFIGDPNLPGHEVLEEGKLHLHRWGQWISAYHPGGVYDGEEGKLSDWNRSLPEWLEKQLLPQKIAGGGSVVILGEEWQTAYSVVALHRKVVEHGWQKAVHLLWNANNTFSFYRIDWQQLRRAATITTVSRYMKHHMWREGVDARVVPNGIPSTWLAPVRRQISTSLAHTFKDRTVLVKVARWDPDKRWMMAVDAVARLKALGRRPLFLVRGGMEPHGEEVLRHAVDAGLVIRMVDVSDGSAEALVPVLKELSDIDVMLFQSHLSEEQCGVLFHSADAVLANSGIEPFGLVGLETMAVGGIAFVGSTGEDYATPGHDSIGLQTSDPGEIVHHTLRLKHSQNEERRLRRAARRAAELYTWEAVIARALLPLIQQLGVDVPLPSPEASLKAPSRAKTPARTASTLRGNGAGLAESLALKKKPLRLNRVLISA